MVHKRLKQRVNRLQLREHTYYIRVAVPERLQDLWGSQNVRYSLQTKDYYEALKKVRIESVKVDLLFATLEQLKMKIENNRLQLTDVELQQLLTYRMREIDNFFSENYKQIKSGSVQNCDEAQMFSEKQLDEYNALDDSIAEPDKEQNTGSPSFITYAMNRLIFRFFKHLKERPNVSLTQLRVADRVAEIEKETKQNSPSVFYLNNGKDNEMKMVKTYRVLKDIDDYARKRFDTTVANEPCIELNPQINTLIDAVKFQKNQELSAAPQTQTSWKKVFQQMVLPKTNVKQASLEQKYKHIETMFMLMDKEYIEDITLADIRSINSLIYRVPERWNIFAPDKKLLDVLLKKDDTRRGLSPTTIKYYMSSFKEFLVFCRKQYLVDVDFADLLIKPKVDKKKNRYQPFEEDELKAIFAPSTYFRRKIHTDNAKFWIPLISLFSGCRLNEACQLMVKDIKTDKGIYYMDIRGDAEDMKSLKTEASVRRVPIHNMLLELGFLDQVEYARKMKKDRIFFNQIYDKKNKYGRNVGRSFAAYLEKIKITSPKKVFHSFRHTVRTKFQNAKVNTGLVYAICGWEGVGTGDTSYMHRDMIDIKELAKAVNKLKYPELKESFEKFKMFKGM